MSILNSIAVFIIGTVVGSFLNVCINRIPVDQSIVKPPSYCPECGTRLAFVDLIPLLNYFFLKGKCRDCSMKISFQYPLVEFLTGILFFIAFYRFDLTRDTLVFVIFMAILLVISFIDIKHGIIPDKLILFSIVSGILLKFDSLSSALIGLSGLLVGGGILLLVAIVSRGGMGGGDIKLAGAIGLYIGWQQTLLMLFISFLFGSIFGLLKILIEKKTLKEAIPFGPFLAIGGIIAMLWGKEIINWYILLFW